MDFGSGVKKAPDPGSATLVISDFKLLFFQGVMELPVFTIHLAPGISETRG